VLTPFHQRPRGEASVAVRVACPAAAGASGACDPLVLAAPLRALVTSIDPDVPVYDTQTMDGALAEFTWPFRVFGTLFVVFGVAALVLAAVGLYAVMAFAVGRRERELGIRIALGARRGAVVRAVFREGGGQLVAGLSVGLLLGTGIGRLGQAVLYQVRPADPVVLAVVAGVLAAAGCAACLVPALRATRVDPVTALRAE
jgi:ABC-type antimicrobial peptide transport system permease subunit